MRRRPPRSTLFPSTTLFRSATDVAGLLRPQPVALQLRVDHLRVVGGVQVAQVVPAGAGPVGHRVGLTPVLPRSEEHTSELQSRQYLVCRLLLEKKKKQ